MSGDPGWISSPFFFSLQNVLRCLLLTHLHSWQDIFILARSPKVLTNNTSIKKREIWHVCVRRREMTFQRGDSICKRMEHWAVRPYLLNLMLLRQDQPNFSRQRNDNTSKGARPPLEQLNGYSLSSLFNQG